MLIERKQIALGASRIVAERKSGDMAVELYASTFTPEPDSYGDVIVKGAFSETLRAEGTARVGLRDHVAGQLIGKVVNLREDSYGLRGRFEFVPGVQLAEETHKLAAAGVLTGVSIGYIVPDGGAYFRNGIRYITEIALWEVSLTTFPANVYARTLLDSDEGKALRAVVDALVAKNSALAVEALFADVRREIRR